MSTGSLKTTVTSCQPNNEQKVERACGRKYVKAKNQVLLVTLEPRRGALGHAKAKNRRTLSL